MTAFHRRQILIALAFLLLGVRYSGTMPVSQADVQIDPTRLAASRVDVSVSVADARTGLVLATDALKSVEVLDAARHPEARFVSDRVALAEDGRLSGGATISGRVTLGEETRPLTLNANVFRRPGSAPDDLSQLTVSLSGALNRSVRRQWLRGPGRKPRDARHHGSDPHRVSRKATCIASNKHKLAARG